MQLYLYLCQKSSLDQLFTKKIVEHSEQNKHNNKYEVDIQEKKISKKQKNLSRAKFFSFDTKIDIYYNIYFSLFRFEILFPNENQRC